MMLLEGVRVIDWGIGQVGPYAAMLLGDLGADVIKIERPGTGDDARQFGPPYLVDPEGKQNNNNSFYLCANRNKRSVTVNIASPEGQQIIRDLAKDVDVFMENYKVGDLKRYGLDYETIKAINPGIIYCSVTGFGQTGPYAPRAGYDAILQAMGGLMSVTGHLDGEPGAGPMKVGPSIVDYMRTIGKAEEALEKMVKRLASRTAFGKKIIEHSVWEQRIGEARADIEMNRLLCLKAADMRRCAATVATSTARRTSSATPAIPRCSRRSPRCCRATRCGMRAI